MNRRLRSLVLGLFVCVPGSAYAAPPSVSPISDMSLNAGGTATVNVVAVDVDGDAITLTSSLPAFAVLNAPTSGSGAVVTTITLTPDAATPTGTHTASVTATAGGESDTEEFAITLAAPGSDLPPAVTAPATIRGSEGDLISFQVFASDPDQDDITSFTAAPLPAGATFLLDTQGPTALLDLLWNSSNGQAGEYDIVFTASNALSGSATTHITVFEVDFPPWMQAISDVTLAEEDSTIVNVTVGDPDSDAINLTTTGLPGFATLNPPTTSTGTESLQTTITIKPKSGDAGSYPVTLTATSSGGSVTDAFTITVTEVTGGVAEGFAFVTGGNVTTRLLSEKPFTCIQVEPLNNSFSVEDVDLSSISMSHLGNTIQAAAGATERSRDTNRNGTPEVKACFSKEDLRALFGGLDPGDNLASVTIDGTLVSGGAFRATLTHRVVVNAAGPGRRDNDGGPPSVEPRVRPNPLNPRAEISFTLKQAGPVRIALYDLHGRLVSTILHEDRTAGDHVVSWDARAGGNRVASGVYFLRIEAAESEHVRRVTVLK